MQIEYTQTLDGLADGIHLATRRTRAGGAVLGLVATVVALEAARVGDGASFGLLAGVAGISFRIAIGRRGALRRQLSRAYPDEMTTTVTVDDHLTVATAYGRVEVAGATIDAVEPIGDGLAVRHAGRPVALIHAEALAHGGEPLREAVLALTRSTSALSAAHEGATHRGTAARSLPLDARVRARRDASQPVSLQAWLAILTCLTLGGLLATHAHGAGLPAWTWYAAWGLALACAVAAWQRQPTLPHSTFSALDWTEGDVEFGVGEDGVHMGTHGMRFWLHWSDVDRLESYDDILVLHDRIGTVVLLPAEAFDDLSAVDAFAQSALAKARPSSTGRGSQPTPPGPFAPPSTDETDTP